MPLRAVGIEQNAIRENGVPRKRHAKMRLATAAALRRRPERSEGSLFAFRLCFAQAKLCAPNSLFSTD